MTSAIAQAIEACLSDYTTDQRGDIGSLVRIEAISAVGVALQKGILPDLEMKHSLQSKVCRLAVENLDKVRFRAWSCIQSNWSQFYDDQAEMM